jgi:hypothetical protein
LFSLIFWQQSYKYNYPTLLAIKSARISEIIDWQNKSAALYVRQEKNDYLLANHFKDILATAVNQDVFTPSVSPYISDQVDQINAVSVRELCRQNTFINNQTYSINQIDGNFSKSSHYIRISGSINEYNADLSGGRIFLVLKSNTHCYVFSTYRSLQTHQLTNTFNGFINNPWFFSLIPKEDLAADDYQIGFIYSMGERIRVDMTSTILHNTISSQVAAFASSIIRATAATVDSMAIAATPVSCDVYKDSLRLVLAVEKIAGNIPTEAIPVLTLYADSTLMHYSCKPIRHNLQLSLPQKPHNLYYASIPLSTLAESTNNASSTGMTFKIGCSYISNNVSVAAVSTHTTVTVPLPSTPSPLVQLPGHLLHENSLRVNIDVFNKNDDYIKITGWGVAKINDIQIKKVYFILLSNRDSLAFRSVRIYRPDVYEGYRNSITDKQAVSGFQALIPISLLSAAIYRPALVVEDQSGNRFFQYTSQIEDQFRVGCSSSVAVDLPAAVDSIMYSIDTFNDKGDCIEITGWCHLNRYGAEDQRVYVVLNDGNNQFVFPAGSVSRPDVATAHGDKIVSGNLFSAGFAVAFSKKNIAGSTYKAGILIEKGNKAYLTWLSQPGFQSLIIN